MSLTKNKSTVSVPCNYERNCPVSKAIRRWFNEIKEKAQITWTTTGVREGCWKHKLSDQRSPQNDIARWNLKPDMAKTTIQNVLYNSLKFRSFKIQNFREIRNTEQYKIF